MSRALVLMKALPPTRGHERLIDFAKGFAGSGVVLMDTAFGEPLVAERCDWIISHIWSTGTPWLFKHIQTSDENPESEGFWERWTARWNALGKFDYVIGSEDYCAKVAECIGARYIPYDPKRELSRAKGTEIRKSPISLFKYVAPDFQSRMRVKVTIWGAESTGKTTLSKALADHHALCNDVEWTYEWARPYLETVGPEITVQTMNDIWHGQYAVEENAMRNAIDKPYIVQDTDLYSTIGYWEQPHWESTLGPVPRGLINDARRHRSDLYIITKSDIPFEPDPIRYGVDHRESPDQYWINLAKKYCLNYVVLTSTDLSARILESRILMQDTFKAKNKELTSYHRV